ncbi:MAG: SBBP repeat-containing protein [Chloroflexi bacterium]|nr:SBBP repeat-containing protein [Chloroflexota bacterium]
MTDRRAECAVGTTQRQPWFWPFAAAFAVLMFLAWGADAPPIVTGGATNTVFGRLPLSFIENAGQDAPGVKFTVDDAPARIRYRPDGYNIELTTPAGSSLVRVTLEGADPASSLESLEPAPGVANFYLGDDPSTWHEAVPMHTSIRYAQPWPGVEAVFDGGSGQIESVYTVAPGGDPGDIRLRYDGEHAPRVALDGQLVIETAAGRIIESAPILYQVVDGQRVAVEGVFAIDNDTVSIRAGDYDRRLPLVIDPTLSYSTYLGGTGSDQANAVAVDGSGNLYLAGFTASTNFPTASPAQAANAGSRDVFVTKLNAAGSALVYSTYIGGGNVDEGNGIAVDGTGNAYVTGSTFSTNFPTLTPLQAANAGGEDAVVFKLTSAGALSYSTYYGGSDDDKAKGIAQNGGSAFIVGKTLSPDLTTATPYQAALSGLSDAFVAKVAAAGSSLTYATYLGGATDEDGRSIAVDSGGSAYVTGSTGSTTFPTASPVQAALAGLQDAFVTKFSTTGTTLTYSTYLGGGATDGGYGIALDAANNAYVTGLTGSTNFPTASPYQAANGGSDDVFVSKLNTAGSALTYSTYIGGTGGDAGFFRPVDTSNRAHITGSTFSTNYPLASAFQSTHTGATADAFVTRLAATGSSLEYSSYLGGSGSDRGWGIVTGATNIAYVGGSTQSTDFPPAAPYQSVYGGLGDAFASKVDGSVSDTDGDGIPDASDNCVSVPNAGQENADRNFIDQTPPSTQDDRTWPNSDWPGDACDTDDDNDGLLDTAEPAGCNGSGPLSPTNRDTDGDRVLDGPECTLGSNPASAASKPAPAACGPTTDADGDRISDRAEICGYNTNPNAMDTDGDQDGFPTTGLAKDGCEAASLNNDRIVNAGDQLLLVLEIIREVTPSLRLVSFDVNKDGVVNSGDQLTLAGFIATAGSCP